MDKSISYTIIIPHKNSPDHLQRCLDSIPRRKDMQIIVVDDNSDFDKVNFEQFPCLSDPSVDILFTKEGNGAGYARNMGLIKALGKWVLFADADDSFAEDLLKHLDNYKNSEYDLVYFRTYRLSRKEGQENNIDKNLDALMKKAIHEQKHDAYKYTMYVPWGKMIRLSLIKEHGILFDETTVANDRMFSLKTAYNAQNVHFDENRIYTYISNNSLLTRIRTPEANFVRFGVYIRMNLFFEKIDQRKFKVNLIPFLKNLISVHDMEYFFNGIKLMKENNISIFFEFFYFCLSTPQRIVKKIFY